MHADLKPRLRYAEISTMQPGAARRAALLAWLHEGRAAGAPNLVFVNRKYQLSTRDPDLRMLLKKGILVQRRRNAGATGHPLAKRSGSFQTYLVLA